MDGRRNGTRLNGNCDCKPEKNGVIEDICHYFLHCIKYEAIRKDMMHAIELIMKENRLNWRWNEMNEYDKIKFLLFTRAYPVPVAVHHMIMKLVVQYMAVSGRFIKQKLLSDLKHDYASSE